MNLGLETGEAAPALIDALHAHLVAAGLWTPRKLARGSLVFGPEAASGEVILLLRGLVKLVYTTAAGDEWIKSFVLDRGVFATQDGDGEAYAAVCLEASEIVRLPRNAIERLAEANDEIRRLALEFSRWVIRRKQAREAALLSMSAEARYRSLREGAPEALRRLPQGDIARFIGVTPIAFSRIKRRTASPSSA